jgi:hypothetical protein
MTNVNAMDVNSVRKLTKEPQENNLARLLMDAELRVITAAFKGIDECRTQPMGKEERAVVTKFFTGAGYLVEDSMVVGALIISWKE